MHIKCLLGVEVSPNGVTPFRFFSDVDDVDVSDHFVDIPGGLDQQLRDDDSWTRHIIHSGYSQNGLGQQQYVRLRFECGGVSHEIYTALPVFITNAANKTIESFHPVFLHHNPPAALAMHAR